MKRKAEKKSRQAYLISSHYDRETDRQEGRKGQRKTKKWKGGREKDRSTESRIEKFLS